jgi:hypothetical protein
MQWSREVIHLMRTRLTTDWVVGHEADRHCLIFAGPSRLSG